MQIYLARNNQQAGPYTVEQLNQMLASQQVLLTDLVWHQGMQEWKALGELTHGQLVYTPSGYIAPTNTPTPQPIATHITEKKPHSLVENQELASLASRFFAKLIDLLLWLPLMAIPSFFFNEAQIQQLADLQKEMQAAQHAEQMTNLQMQVVHLIPNDAWYIMGAYLLIMLAIQAILLAKTGQSVGKRLTKIKIVDAENGESVSLMRAFTLRSFLFIFLNILLMPFITFIDAVFAIGEKRQTLHDKLVKTKVIKQ